VSLRVFIRKRLVHLAEKILLPQPLTFGGGLPIDADQAARRLYVAHNGAVLSGMPAFRVLWAQMPRYRVLARVTGWPIVRPFTVLAYDHVLAPLIYRWHIRRQSWSK